MQQRRPRLGDILDDYCPRERRVTNHAVVAIVDEEVRQTRCTTCDAEHEYKQAKVPTPRRAKSQAALTHEADGSRPVLAVARSVAPSAPAAEDAAETPEIPVVASALDEPPQTNVVLERAAASAVPEPSEAAQAPEVSEAAEAADSTDPREDDGPVHRRLIRATFPRPEGQTPERREPEFTVRQPGGRGREGDGNRFGFRGRNQRHGQQGGSWNFGSRQGGFGSDGQRGARGPGGNRQGGGQNRGQRQGGAGRKGGR
jgi:hypothetical protein